MHYMPNIRIYVCIQIKIKLNISILIKQCLTGNVFVFIAKIQQPEGYKTHIHSLKATFTENFKIIYKLLNQQNEFILKLLYMY